MSQVKSITLYICNQKYKIKIKRVQSIYKIISKIDTKIIQVEKINYYQSKLDKN